MATVTTSLLPFSLHITIGNKVDVAKVLLKIRVLHKSALASWKGTAEWFLSSMFVSYVMLKVVSAAKWFLISVAPLPETFETTSLHCSVVSFLRVHMHFGNVGSKRYDSIKDHLTPLP
jgi:hypothetical protein